MCDGVMEREKGRPREGEEERKMGFRWGAGAPSVWKW